MSDLHVTYMKIVVSKNRTAHGTDENGVVLKPEFLESLGDELMGYAVSAARAVVGLVLQVRLALIGVVKNWGLGVDDLEPVVGDLRLLELTFSSAIVISFAYTNAAMHPATCANSSSVEGTLPPPRP